MLDNTQKYVASTTLAEPLPWSNSTLLEGDAAEAVAGLKAQPGKDIVVLGSGELVQSLMRRDLVDEYVLLIHPLVLGSGRRLFADGGASAALRLVDTKTTTTGVDDRDLPAGRAGSAQTTEEEHPDEAVPAQHLPARRARRRARGPGAGSCATSTP